ncbi:alpha/beta fold hydrolase [Luteococcus sp. Sow4_B9]|uniref:alpha/beta fold hydrolase n=1 Tax=Luteococcus sp. Sow4_B9 TaxID=3438792 RepID=UPI003F98D71F
MTTAPVVLLHGASSSCATWDRLRRDLEKVGVPSHAYPLLGHAEEPRRARYRLADFRDHVLGQLGALGDEPVILVGHSLGAFTASLVAQAVPRRVARLVLEEPPVPPRHTGDDWPFTTVAGARMWALSPLTRRRMDPRALRQVLAELTQPQPGWWAGLSAITAPTLVIAGGRRSYLRQERFSALASRLPAATVEHIEAGHRVHSVKPEAFGAVVIPFLTS